MTCETFLIASVAGLALIAGILSFRLLTSNNKKEKEVATAENILIDLKNTIQVQALSLTEERVIKTGWNYLLKCYSSG